MLAGGSAEVDVFPGEGAAAPGFPDGRPLGVSPLVDGRSC